MSQLEASKKLDGNGKKVTPTKSLCSNQLELVPVIIPQRELVTVIIPQIELVIDWPNDSVTNANIDFHIPDCTEDVLLCISLM